MSRANVTGTSPVTDLSTAQPDRRDTARFRTAAIVVFVIGLIARLAPVLHGGGLRSDLGYDPGVYFAAADGFVHGRLPYRDFVLLHPPGIMLALAPFAAATKFVSDQTAFVGANLAFTILGAFNTVLVVVVGRKFCLSLTASVGGGLFAALWLGSVHAEDMARLEPLANLLVLLAFYAYAVARRHPSARWFFAMGAALGAATSVKIWYVVPLIVLLAWVAIRVRVGRAVVAAMSGAAAALLAINGFFFWHAPVAMSQMIVVDQVGRRRFSASPIARFDQANDVATWNRLLGPGPTAVAIAVLILGALLLLKVSWRQPIGHPFVVLVGVQLVVLAVSPSYFAFYADYLTPALALALAVGVDSVRSARRTPVGAGRRTATRISPLAAVVGLVVLIVPLCWQRAGAAFPGARLASAVGTERCVTADSPMSLIELNALSRSFSAGCQDWVDVVGRTYGVDRSQFPRRDNPAWQRDLEAYLLSGNAFIVIRPTTGLSPATRVALTHRPVVARAGGWVIFRGRSAGG